MFTRSRGRVLRAVTALTIAAGAFVGATGTAHAALNTYIPVSMTADGHGYATISTVGKVTARGTVAWRGDPHGFTGQMVGIAVTAKGDGYMAISDHGQVYSFGNVAYHGNPTGFTGKIVGISITADGKGYVAMSDHGQVYAYGTAKYHANPTGYSGSMARIAVTGDGLGYVAVSSTGQVYAYGTVKYRGNPKVTSPVSGIAVTADGQGYAIIEWNGTVHTAGTVTWRANPHGFTGIMTSITVAADGHGYVAMSSSGQMYANNTPYLGNADPGKPDPEPTSGWPQIVFLARKTSAETGVPVSVLLTQSSDETGHWTSSGWLQNFNPAGIGACDGCPIPKFASPDAGWESYGQHLLGHGEGGQQQFIADVQAHKPPIVLLQDLEASPWSSAHYHWHDLENLFPKYQKWDDPNLVPQNVPQPW